MEGSEIYFSFINPRSDFIPIDFCPGEISLA